MFCCNESMLRRLIHFKLSHRDMRSNERYKHEWSSNCDSLLSTSLTGKFKLVHLHGYFVGFSYKTFTSHVLHSYISHFLAVEVHAGDGPIKFFEMLIFVAIELQFEISELRVTVQCIFCAVIAFCVCYDTFLTHEIILLNVQQKRMKFMFSAWNFRSPNNRQIRPRIVMRPSICCCLSHLSHYSCSHASGHPDITSQSNSRQVRHVVVF